jgi:hypothetical protein
MAVASRRAAALAVASLLLLHLARLPVVPAAAQEATPGAGPLVPDPAECTVAPRPAAELRDLLAASDMPGEPDESATLPAPLLLDAPADPETVAGITATAREIIACANAGDLRRRSALYSDAFIRRGGMGFADREDVKRKPVPLPASERGALLAGPFVRPLTDGRVGAVMVINDPMVPSPAEALFCIFVQVEDRWLLDEIPNPFQLIVDEPVVSDVTPEAEVPGP